MLRHWLATASLFLFLSSTGTIACAQSNLSLPGCEASPEVRQIINDKLESPEFQNLTYAERNKITEQVLTRLIEKYPRELEPYQRLIGNAKDQYTNSPEPLAKLREEFQQKAKEHPDDPLMLYLAATALRDKDTPLSIQLDNRAIALAPNFPWPYADLTGIYWRGKTMDKDKERENLRKFWNLCPTSTDGSMRGLHLVKDIELQAKVAAAERAFLATATDPSVLKNYDFLWGLEFRLSPVADYPALRKKVTADLARLETANPKPDAGWAAFLIGGYKQSGAPQEVITAKEDELLKAYPHSAEALEIVENRWEDAYKQPENQKDVAAWVQYRAAYKSAVQQWVREFPDSYHDLVQSLFFAFADDDSVSEADAATVLDAYLKDVPEHWGPSPWNLENAAEFLLDHKWQPARALDLLEQAQDLFAKEDTAYDANDNHSVKDSEDRAKFLTYRSNTMAGEILLAAARAGKPPVASSLRSSVEGPAPTDKKYESLYWRNRARLAVLEGRKADGLIYYQLALQTRQEPPKFQRGLFKDELSDEARGLWNQLGGSEAAWAAWSKQPPQTPIDTNAAHWEKPTQTLPDFSLTDLSGKTWRLADLHGKVVLVNLWATWCGPCNAELPQMEKLYEQVKDRSDMQILTFDIDEDLGLVDPYLKKKGYTFPVLPAYSYTVNLLNGWTIPQNWILDANGTWLWTQVGYDGDDSWQHDILAKLESAKTGK